MTDNDVVRRLGDARPMLRSTPEIIVGVDDDATAGGTLVCAARQSRLTGLPLRVVHVWQISALLTVPASRGVHLYSAAAAADARARATRRVVGILGGSTDIRWTLEVIEGAPGPALVARSATAQLLVLGTGDHAGLRRAALGSVSRFCMSHAAPPILTVPATAVVSEQLGGHGAEPASAG